MNVLYGQKTKHAETKKEEVREEGGVRGRLSLYPCVIVLDLLAIDKTFSRRLTMRVVEDSRFAVYKIAIARDSRSNRHTPLTRDDSYT